MEITVYRAQVKHIKHTLKIITDDNLDRLLGRLTKWRETESNIHQDYDLYIHDHNNKLVFGSRF